MTCEYSQFSSAKAIKRIPNFILWVIEAVQPLSNDFTTLNINLLKYRTKIMLLSYKLVLKIVI